MLLWSKGVSFEGQVVFNKYTNRGAYVLLAGAIFVGYIPSGW